jgi:RHS repeat-associated protein
VAEQVGTSNYTATYNALNQISTSSAPGFTRTNEWDALDRLVAVNVGNQRTEFTYDGLSRRVAIRHLVNGSEVSLRRFVWSDSEICEERNGAGAVTKRFFPQGMKVETGPNAGNYFYTRDHLGSVRELTDSSGNVRARYAYDPYGHRTRLEGDMEADLGFATMFRCGEADLDLTQFRAYAPQLGRWLSRDPLEDAELEEGPNLYAYVGNDPINMTDFLGLYGGEIVEVLGEIVEVPAIWGELGEIAPVWGQLVEVGTPDYWRTLRGGTTRWNELYRRGVISQREWLEKANRPLFEKMYPKAKPRIAPTKFTGISGGAGAFIGAGITILAMTDCNTAEGIFALYRQGNGGMANKHADKLFKQLKKQGLL